MGTPNTREQQSLSNRHPLQWTASLHPPATSQSPTAAATADRGTTSGQRSPSAAQSADAESCSSRERSGWSSSKRGRRHAKTDGLAFVSAGKLCITCTLPTRPAGVGILVDIHPLKSSSGVSPPMPREHARLPILSVPPTYPTFSLVVLKQSSALDNCVVSS